MLLKDESLLALDGLLGGGALGDVAVVGVDAFGVAAGAINSPKSLRVFFGQTVQIFEDVGVGGLVFVGGYADGAVDGALPYPALTLGDDVLAYPLEEAFLAFYGVGFAGCDAFALIVAHGASLLAGCDES